MVLHQPLQLPVSSLAPVPYHQQLPVSISVLLLRSGRRCADRVLRQQLPPHPIDLPRPLTPHRTHDSPSLSVVDIPTHRHPSVFHIHQPILAIIDEVLGDSACVSVSHQIARLVIFHRSASTWRQQAIVVLHGVNCKGFAVDSASSVSLVDCAVAPTVIKERLPEHPLVYIFA